MDIRDALTTAEEKKAAIGHFNFANLEGLWAAVSAARELSVPVFVATSEGEREFVGPRQAVALVRSIREETGHPVFLNADHTYSVEKVREAAAAGYDSVIFDGAKLPFEENIARTTEAVRAAKGENPDILVEGELGYIGTSSKMLDEIPEGAAASEEYYTKPEEAREFVKETGVDLFAPSVGNLHGMLKHAKNPHLSIERIGELKEATGIPLVLHGGSGISDEDFARAIAAGFRIVHISTELRVALREGIERSLAENPEELAPYRYMKGPRDAVSEVVARRLALFNNIS